MDCYEARLESFNRSRRVKTKSGTVNLKWPHPDTYLATPEQLAEAGFYFSPSVEARDNVKCFMCRKELDEWDEDDDPISVHFARCRDICAWAVARCGNLEDLDASGGFTFKDPSRAPTSKTMEKARHETFASTWPHDSIRGHGASSKEMAKAGFLYAPHSAGDDTAICVYCTTTLSGWDADDDPLEEHRKRVAKSGRRCAFFEMLEGSSKPSQPTRATKSISRSTSQSLSKEKSVEVVQAVDDEPSSDDVSELTILTTAKSKRTTRSSSVPMKTPGSRKSTRSAGTSRTKGTAAEETEEEIEASGSEIGKRVSKSKKKGTKKAKEAIEVIAEVDEGGGLGGFEEEPAARKPKRGRPPGKSKAVPKARKAAETVPGDSEIEPPPDKPSRTRTRSKVVDDAQETTKAPSSQPKTKSSTKRKKAEEPPPEDQVDEAALVPPPKMRTKPRGTTVSKTKAIEIESDDEELPTFEAQVQETRKPVKTVPSSRHLQENPPSIPTQVDASSQAKGRKSSSTSDDAGYATAEQPMEVDDVHQSRERSKSRGTSLNEKFEQQPMLSADPSTAEVPLGADVDMQGDSEPTQENRPRQLSNAHVPAPRQPSKPSVKTQVRVTSRSTSSLARPPSRLGTEIVDISSDDELDVLKVIAGEKPPSTSSRGSGTGPPTSIAPSSSSTFFPSKTSKQSPPAGSEQIRQSISNRSIGKGVSEKSATVPLAASSTTSPEVAMDVGWEMPVGSEVKPSPSAQLKQRDMEPIERPLGPSTPPPDIFNVPLSKPVSSSALALPSFDEEIAAEKEHVKDPAVDAFTPFLSMVSVGKLTSLTEDECDLTLEQYIRQELERQYQQFKEDGDRQIALFKQRAAEARKMIETL
ncbi:hypothetical protein BDY19DRAFT_1068262 [Irpex rosettiformis]|uniref:Uncharacterized protein n=1 Tax=Irpex rosettiformis TaxID=378272 RepID=A0ACB8U8P4_9APHY|nr:hypothetical protein BDY19DRAFT_1068262 [Irpex rosettiformis]